jgi:hypothetical protein
MGMELTAVGAVPDVNPDQARLAALRLIRAGLRHPHETNPLRMAQDVAQALGLTPTVPRGQRRDSVTRAMRGPIPAAPRNAPPPRRPCAGCSHGTTRHTVLGCTTHGCYCLAFIAPATH